LEVYTCDSFMEILERAFRGLMQKYAEKYTDYPLEVFLKDIPGRLEKGINYLFYKDREGEFVIEGNRDEANGPDRST
jgi:hypothetical protein